jgi:hypothetical protein
VITRAQAQTLCNTIVLFRNHCSNNKNNTILIQAQLSWECLIIQQNTNILSHANVSYDLRLLPAYPQCTSLSKLRLDDTDQELTLPILVTSLSNDILIAVIFK